MNQQSIRLPAIKTEGIGPVVDKAITHFQTCSDWHPGGGEDALLRVPAGYNGQAVIELEPEENQAITIIIEENADVRILERGEGEYTVDILIHPNAKLHYFSASTKNVSVRRHAHLLEDASVLWIDAAYGEHVKAHVTSYLAGVGADAQFESVFLGKDSERYNIMSRMVHAASHSTSNMLTRAVMLERSKGEYEGMIRIYPTASGCDAYQKQETILLSEEAKMDAQPNLEISNEDVRCSHGVSLGQLDEDKIFYLKSRGIRREIAIELIVQGFFSEILDRMGEQATPVKKALLARL